MRRLVFAALAVTLAATAAAQEAVTTRPAPPTPQDSALHRALRLPELMQRARQAGAPDSLIRVVIDDMRRRGVPAEEAAAVTEAEVEAVEAGAPRENFGAFVREQLDRGLRGRELAEQIRAEHARRGFGRPEGVGRPDSARGAQRGGPPASAGQRGRDTIPAGQQGRRP